MNKILTLLFAALVLCTAGTYTATAQAPTGTATAADPAVIAKLQAAVDKAQAAYDTAKGAKKKKAKKTLDAAKAKLARAQSSASSSATPAAPVDTLEPVRTVSLDSIEYNKTGYNPLSILGIHRSKLMYRMRIRRQIDFLDKCNTPFNNRGTEFVRFVMDGLKSGEIQGWNDSLNRTIRKKDMVKKMSLQIDPNDPNTVVYATVDKLNYVYMDEDLVFDRQRSQTRTDILAFTLLVPIGTFGDGLPGFETPLATVRYKDVERLLDSKPTARWKNPYNNAEDRKISEAFRLRLFCSHIIYIQRDNATGERIDQIAAFTDQGKDLDKGPLLAAQNFEYLLVSQENELYEY